MKRGLLIFGGVLLGLPLLAIAGFLVFFDADAFRPRLEAAVQRATARDFRIEGPLRLTPALTPTLQADGLVLANLAGGSAPDMLRIAHAELRLALWPLLSGRVEVAGLRLEGGHLLLERENWRFTRPKPVASATPAPVATPPRPLPLDFRAITLRDWRVTANGEEFRLPQLRLVEGELSATLILRGAEALIEGRLGNPAAPAWPFRLGVVLPGARIAVEGQRDNADVTAAITAEIPRLETLSTLAGRGLPALTGVSLRARASVTGAGATLSALEGRAAGGELAGVTLTAARVTQASQDAPLRAEASGTYRGEPVTLVAEAVPAALIAGTATPLTLRLASRDAFVGLTGEWPAALLLEAAAPDVARLSTLAGRPLPPLRDATLRAALAPIETRFAEGVRIQEFTMASSAGDVAGALDVRWAGLPAITGRIASTRLDLNALRAPAVIAAPQTAPAAMPAPPPPPPPSGRLIAATPVDFGPLRLFNANLGFTMAEITTGALVLRGIEGHFVNQDGQARLDPFAITPPGGRLNLRVAAQAGGAAGGAMHMAGGGEGLDPVALLGAFGVASPITGRTDLEMDLRGQGADLRAVAASTTGHLGLAVTGGRLAAQVLNGLPGFAGGVPVACLAVRGEAQQGVVRFRALHLEGAAGRMTGEGGLSLRDESLNIRMQADLRVAGVRVRAPVPLTGTLANPRLELAGLSDGGQGGNFSDCPTSLRIARNGREGVAAVAVPPPAQNALPALDNLLRGLLGR